MFFGRLTLWIVAVMAIPLITVYLLLVNALIAALFLLGSIALVAGVAYLMRASESREADEGSGQNRI